MELTQALSCNVRLPRSLSRTSLPVLAAAIDGAFSAPARIVCLRGESDTVFCTGLAIESAPHDASRPELQEFALLLARLLDAPKPTIAIVEGSALGGGVGLAAACDWVMATEAATFGLPELLWGLVPAIIWPVITERMSARAARSWCVTAHARNVQDALADGLVDEVIPGGSGTHVERRLRSLARIEPRALAMLRDWSRQTRTLHVNDALPEGARITADLMDNTTVRTRLAAFERGEAPWPPWEEEER
ncbi:MAG TPA: enoyl-CoA hydratase/isomerase family protein [Vicinamibacterales bacterium]|nr:enoyl-CoA hydratase/isomerase family protein [Vicinamibacterales bacterium]